MLDVLARTMFTATGHRDQPDHRPNRPALRDLALEQSIEAEKRRLLRRLFWI